MVLSLKVGVLEVGTKSPSGPQHPERIAETYLQGNKEI